MQTRPDATFLGMMSHFPGNYVMYRDPLIVLLMREPSMAAAALRELTGLISLKPG